MNQKSIKAQWSFYLAIGLAALSSVPAMAKSMDLVLKLKPRVSMAQLAYSVLNPSSPRFQRFYSPSEIKSIAAPTNATLLALQKDLEDSGIQVISLSITGLEMTVRGDSTLFERVFQTQLAYSDSSLQYYWVRSPVRIPQTFSAIESVVGMNHLTRRVPRYRVARAGFSSQPGGVSPAQIRAVYNFNPIYKSGVTGRAQDIAIATYDSFNISDVKSYYSKMGVSPAPSVEQVKFNGEPAVNLDSAGETELDAELSGMIAPGARIHVFTSASNNDTGEIQVFTAILDDGRAKIVNYSWGSCETQVTVEHRTALDELFARAVAQGVNILVASGDSGSAGCPGSSATVADFPSSPLITLVGGTSLMATGQSGQYNEVAWTGSGGGVSGLYAASPWAASLPAPYNQRRSVPDVAFNADNVNSGEAIYITDPDTGQPAFIVVGGTSMASPQWAGLLALVSEGRQGRPLPQLNGILYALNAAQRSSLMHDVESGSNGAYTAGPGWDAVTGWGSPRAAQLYSFLQSVK